ncbi:hypothetical protein Acy02nite_30910 [Actinoplanes cyaneus]|uniref:Uncharacterized protein n=1 Tax=Actinoplanes cyaneus TaxID=52696 RepID=A0A919M0K1_9ACTN|nr:hypothetical protein Acy02nite_30910 [Actinoplanes cyaneus]
MAVADPPEPEPESLPESPQAASSIPVPATPAMPIAARRSTPLIVSASRGLDVVRNLTDRGMRIGRFLPW